MPGRIVRKWRPPLSLVLGGTLAAVLGVPLVGIAYFRVAGSVLGWAETAWLIGWMAVVATAILGLLLWRLVLRPVQSLTGYAQSISAGRAASPPRHFGTPEFSTLGQSVIDMGDHLHRRAEHMRAYADHVTHELKSPLTTLRGAAELLEDGGLSQDEQDALVSRITTATSQMAEQLDALRRLAHADTTPMRGASRLVEVLPRIEKRYPSVVISVLQDGSVPFPPQTLEPVLDHLVANASEHGADRITLSVKRGGLEITDNGRGISPGNRERIFDPFFTTRRSGGGTGMGLPIVRRMLEAQGADITLLESPSGARFRVEFHR